MWDESFYLYVKDPSTAVLSFRAMDKDLFKDDDLMGVGAISVRELQVQKNKNKSNKFLVQYLFNILYAIMIKYISLPS